MLHRTIHKGTGNGEEGTGDSYLYPLKGMGIRPDFFIPHSLFPVKEFPFFVNSLGIQLQRHRSNRFNIRIETTNLNSSSPLALD